MTAIPLPTIILNKTAVLTQFLNIPQTAAHLRLVPSGYFIWQNGRFPPKPLAIPHHANQQTLLLQPKRSAIPKT